ncbi:unnamed protein product, partial [Iphiclides podalirius]
MLLSLRETSISKASLASVATPFPAELVFQYFPRDTQGIVVSRTTTRTSVLWTDNDIAALNQLGRVIGQIYPAPDCRGRFARNDVTASKHSALSAKE